MSKYLIGFFIAYTITATWYAYMLHTGRVASISQACVERVTAAPVDFVTELEQRRK